MKHAIAACLLAMLAGIGAVTTARAADPVSINQIFGFVTSAVPDALRYVYKPPLTDQSGGVNALFSNIYFRKAAPTVNTSGVTTLTAQSQDATKQQINSGSISFAYDTSANTTNITIKNSTDQAQVIVPINMQQVFSDQDPQITSGTLVVNPKTGTSQTNSFSGSVGSNTYQGKLVNYSGGANGDAFTAYQMLDSAGNTILYARANNGGVPDFRIPGAMGLGNGVYGPTPSGAVLPPACGSGTFTQVKNGQTLTGTFQPVSFSVSTLEASQDAYWSTH